MSPDVCRPQELPELVYLHPPLTVFVMEQRAFGRLVLVGSHVVQSLMHFAPRDLEEWREEEEEEPEPPGEEDHGCDRHSALSLPSLFYWFENGMFDLPAEDCFCFNVCGRFGHYESLNVQS